MKYQLEYTNKIKYGLGMVVNSTYKMQQTIIPYRDEKIWHA